MRLITLLTIAALAFSVCPAFADRGGNGGGNGKGNGNVTASSGSCSVSGNVVSGAGLPVDEVINFMITDANGSWGWVLGFSGDGTWNVEVPTADGSTTYEFVSRTWGPDGSKYTVFASCSA
jgi:hypothetical protein